jgi:hypothetical protein
MATAFDYSFNEPILEGLPDDVQNSIRRILQEAAQVRADTVDPLSSRAASQRSQAELLEGQAARILMANRPDLKNLTGEETIDAIAQRKFNVPSYYALDKNQKAAVDKEFEAASDKVRLPRALENLGIRYPAAAPRVFSSEEAAPEAAPVAAMPVAAPVAEAVIAPVVAQAPTQAPTSIAGLLAPDAAPAAPAVPAARKSQSVEGLLGSLFGGNELEDLMTPQQRAAINQRGLLAAAAALLQAGGPSTRRVSLGQALGSALEAGQTGAERAQQSALTQMLTRQKLEEARQEALATQGFRSALEGMRGGGAAPAMTPEQALAAPNLPTGPTVARAQMVGQPAPAGMGAPGARVLTDAQISLLQNLPRKEAAAELLKLTQPPAPSDKAKLLGELGMPVTIENLRLLDRPEAAPEKIRTLQALGLEPSIANLRQLDKPDASPSEIRILEATNTPVTLQNVMNLRRAGATTINIAEGQKGFENEMKLASAFKGEPIYKDFNEMKSAYGQVITSLNQNTPIGDVAGATKVMKLLDPGSVVRESELGIAMAASGRMDRLSNYFNMWSSGQKLTPTQRDDFKVLSNELYAAAAQAYNAKRDEYKGFGNAYNFKNLDAALGAPATAPSVMRRETPARGASQAPGGAARPSLGDIFNR